MDKHVQRQMGCTSCLNVENLCRPGILPDVSAFRFTLQCGYYQAHATSHSSVGTIKHMLLHTPVWVLSSTCYFTLQCGYYQAHATSHSSVGTIKHMLLHTPVWVLSRVHNQECATACTTSMLCCDGRTSHHVTWFKRLCWQTVQSDHKRVVPKAGLRTTQYLSCTRVHGFIT